MFGYVTIYHKGLAKPELDRYQAYYCGLCRTLGQKYGLPGQLTLSYDLAFIAILHSALYEPQTQFSAGRCAPHPIKARPRAANEFLDYAADMTIALAYYNFLDNWQDDHSRASLHQAQKLEPYLPAIRARYLRYPAFVEAVADRHERYNETLEHVAMLEQTGQAFVIRPPIPLEIGSMERDPAQLRRVYDTGRAVAEIQVDKIAAFVEQSRAAE